ncbi:MAG: sigma 54-interacting transcriptional regulator, partial [Acidocella sp.]|nr:sigma 54-interacting transcriptional regulator [Acidocella sp.]
NSAMERLAGIAAAAAERLPFAKFLRRAGWDLEENGGSRNDGRASLVSQLDRRSLPVLRRILTVNDSATGYTVYIVRPEAMPAPAPRPGRAAAGEAPTLLFPETLEEQVRRAARAYRRRVRILLLGESGVGKTAIARHVHNQAAGRDAPFVHVNCGSIPETLFESEMFGYERGAFTGALQAGKRGYIETAKGGTLFLDEVGEIPLSSQAKLLKFLEDNTIQPVGSAVSKCIETTVITATNRDLRQMIAQGSFRGDLFYRIANFPVPIPPLRERSDKEALLDAILTKVNAGRQPRLRLSPPCRAMLLAAPLPGNVRELSSIIDYLDIVADEVATPAHLAEGLISPEPATTPLPVEGKLKDMTATFEDQMIRAAIARHGSKREAARHLGIDGATLIRKLRRTPG